MPEVKIIKVDPEDTKDVFEKDVAASTTQSLLSNFIATNVTADDELFFERPSFKAYERRLVRQKMDFETARLNIEAKYVPKDFVGDWALNYATSELTLTSSQA